METPKLNKSNRIKLIVNLALLLVSIMLIYMVYCVNSSALFMWYGFTAFSRIVTSCLCVATTSIFAIGAIRSVTSSYRIFCIALPLIIMLIPQVLHMYGFLSFVPVADPAAEPMVLQNHAFLQQVNNAALITGLVIFLAVLLWELKRANLIGAKRVKKPSGILAR